MSTKSTSHKPRRKTAKGGAASTALRTIWMDSRKRPKAYVDRFVVPSEGE
jgi:hypothetical protein